MKLCNVFSRKSNFIEEIKHDTNIPVIFTFPTGRTKVSTLIWYLLCIGCIILYWLLCCSLSVLWIQTDVSFSQRDTRRGNTSRYLPSITVLITPRQRSPWTGLAEWGVISDNVYSHYFMLYYLSFIRLSLFYFTFYHFNPPCKMIGNCCSLTVLFRVQKINYMIRYYYQIHESIVY